VNSARDECETDFTKEKKHGANETLCRDRIYVHYGYWTRLTVLKSDNCVLILLQEFADYKEEM
jgi:hypothetical protein